MEYDYGYGNLGNEIIKLFSKGEPDFDAAEELIKQGADLNAEEMMMKRIFCLKFCRATGCQLKTITIEMYVILAMRATAMIARTTQT